MTNRQGKPRRGGIKPKRDTPRRREAPRWTAEEWAEADVQLRRRAGGRCECCQEPLGRDVERHHRLRRRDGGDRLSNLLLLRRECHQWITEHPEWARECGFIVATGHMPPAVPVHHHRARWVVLDDEGGWTPLPGEPIPAAQA